MFAATAVAALVGAVRRADARDVVLGVVRYACAWPVLLTLIAMSVAGVGSRVALGYLSPGAYAEDVLAARSFLAGNELYAARGGAELETVLAESPVPWTDVPGITACQANAFANRARFYTEHAHTPMLLLAAIPVVRAGGGQGLYVLIALLSLASAGVMAAILVNWTLVPWGSRESLLALTLVVGWQPVLAGVRQGDAVIIAAGLTAAAWYLARKSGRAGGVAAALAVCLAVPAIGAVLAMVRAGGRAAAAAALAFLAAIAVTVAIAGVSVFPGFLQTISQSTTTYAAATANYSLAGRMLQLGGERALITAIVLLLAFSWWRSRTADMAFALFLSASLVAAPLVWSQHLALLFVPLVLLFCHAVTGGSSLALAGWAAVALSVSLPDTTVIAFSRTVAVIAGPVAVAPLGLLVLWTWTMVSSRTLAASAQTAHVAVTVLS